MLNSMNNLLILIMNSPDESNYSMLIELIRHVCSTR